MNEDEQFRFLISDFESTWTALQAEQHVDGRANYLLADLVMIVLEWCSRIIVANTPDDATRTQLEDRFIGALPPLYLTSLAPLEMPNSAPRALFRRNPRALIVIAFDLLRNGIAHKYDGSTWPVAGGRLSFSVTGAAFGVARDNPGLIATNLAWRQNAMGIEIRLNPSVAMNDIVSAARAAGLPTLPNPVPDDFKTLVAATN